MPGPAGRSQQSQPSEPTIHERAFLYQFFGKAEAPDTWTADTACPADSPVLYAVTAKAETLLGEARAPANPTTPLRNAHSCGMSTPPPQSRPGSRMQGRTRGQVPAPPARPATCVPLPEPVALPETMPGAEGEAA